MAYQSFLNPHPVTGPLTDVQLRASTVAVSGTTPTDALANASVPATGLMGFGGGTWDRLRTIGGLTDTQPTATAMLAVGGYVFNGTTWDRMRGTTAGMSVVVNAALPSGANAIGSVSVSNFPATQAVSLTSTTITGSVAVTGTFFQATQPVSGTVTVGNASLPVTGTFFQAMQPVSLASTTITGSVAVTGTTPTDALANASVPATGMMAFGGATWDRLRTIGGLTDAQPAATAMLATGSYVFNGTTWDRARGTTTGAHVVINAALPAGANAIGSVSVSNFPASQAVTGAFYQATQPVSGTVTVGNASLAVTGPLTDAQLRLTAVPISGSVSVSNFPASQAVTGTFFQATQPVSLGALPAGTNNIGTVGTQATADALAGTSLVASGLMGFGGGSWDRLRTIGGLGDGQPPATAMLANGNYTFNGSTWDRMRSSAKGVQASAATAVQDLKDSGRVNFAAATVVAGVTAGIAEALLSIVPVRDGVAGAAVTSIAVTAGKRLSIQIVNAGLTNTGATAISARVVVRMSSTGAVTATSPILTTLNLHAPAAADLSGDHEDIPIPDGFEISGTMQIGLTQIASVATGTIRASIVGFEY